MTKNKDVFWNPLSTYKPNTKAVFLFDNGITLEGVHGTSMVDPTYKFSRGLPLVVGWLPKTYFNEIPKWKPWPANNDSNEYGYNLKITENTSISLIKNQYENYWSVIISIFNKSMHKSFLSSMPSSEAKDLAYKESMDRLNSMKEELIEVISILLDYE